MQYKNNKNKAPRAYARGISEYLAESEKRNSSEAEYPPSLKLRKGYSPLSPSSSSLRSGYSAKENKKLEAIIILGGGLIKNRDDIWQTRNYNDDSGGGERIRVLAGYYLYKHTKKSVIVASGGKGKKLHEPTTVTISSVIKSELMKLGIPKQKIIEDNKSISTFEQLKLAGKLIDKYSKIFIISNKYHLPRIKAMIAYIPELKFLKDKVRIISGENTIIKYGPSKWHRIISAAYQTSAMKKRIAQEKQGIKDITTDFRKLD